MEVYSKNYMKPNNDRSMHHVLQDSSPVTNSYYAHKNSEDGRRLLSLILFHRNVRLL